MRRPQGNKISSNENREAKSITWKAEAPRLLCVNFKKRSRPLFYLFGAHVLTALFSKMQLPAWPNTASPFFHQQNNPRSNRDPFPTPSQPQNDPNRVTGRSKTLKWHPKRVSGTSKLGPRELPTDPRRPSWTHPGIPDAPRTAGGAIHAARAGPNEGPRCQWALPARPRPPPLSTLHEGER